jgi:uncharacterized protein DUF4411
MGKLPYWLDANVFIESNNSGLNIDLAPTFWSWLEEQLKTGAACSSVLVYKELLGKDDQLAKWAKVRKGTTYWPEPDNEVQAAYQVIANYVAQQYGEGR